MKNDLLEKIEEHEKKQRSEELHRDAERSLQQAKEDEAIRREYEEKLRREKLELIKLKQGQIDEEDIEREPEPEKREYTLKEKISNFFYHYKFHVIAIAVCVFFIVFITVDQLQAERPDVQAMFIADDYNMTYLCDNIKECWSAYAPDVNHDRKGLAKLYYVPAGYTDMDSASLYLAQADRTKLIGEFQSGTTIMIIGNMKAYETLGVEEDVFVDARELFPGDEYAEEIGYRLSGTDFKEIIGYEDMDDSELYVSFRKPVKTFGMSEEKMQKNFDDAVALWRGYISEHRKAPATSDE
ncbi:MAG: hypothetical protein IKR73_03440 [Oscillospiraceae bacterium]|nr:hypothetical protein [Oscillospiraceae bacterium]